MASESPPFTGLADSRAQAINSIFATLSCYEVMQQSQKVLVFETTIPFQLGFYALVEHDSDISALWDPSIRQFVSLMSISDYVRAVLVCHDKDIPVLELSSKSIADLLSSPLVPFKHPCFDAIDAEESILTLIQKLRSTNADFVPVISVSDGKLVTILGYLNIIYLLDQASKQHPNLFIETIGEMGVGTFHNKVVTVNKNVLLVDAIRLFDTHKISGVPVLDETTGHLVSYLHKSEVNFITRVSDTGAMIANLKTMTVGGVIALRDELRASGENLPVTSQSLVTATLSDTIVAVLNSMNQSRVTKVIIVDRNSNPCQCIGVVSIKDILQYYSENL